MLVDSLKMASAYLAMWKAIDVHFPGHHLLEITNEEERSSSEELRRLLDQDLSVWAAQPDELRLEINQTLALIGHSPKDARWKADASVVKSVFQEKALEWAAQLPEPPAVSIGAVG